MHVAPLYIAIRDGYFEEEGLTVEPQTAQGGAAIIPAIVAGEFNMGYSNYVSILLADQGGLDLRIVSENDRASDDHGVYALADSGINSPADLAGKTIAVNTLNNIGTVGIRSVLEAEGVDPLSVELIEIPYPDMAAALERGDVDSVWVVEPFQTGLTSSLDVVLALDLFSGPADELPVAGYVTTEQFAAANPNTIAAFVRALERATEDVENDPSLIAEIVPTYSSIPPEVAAEVGLPTFVADSDPAELQRVADLMLETGVTSEPIDVQSVLGP